MELFPRIRCRTEFIPVQGGVRAGRLAGLPSFPRRTTLRRHPHRYGPHGALTLARCDNEEARRTSCAAGQDPPSRRHVEFGLNPSDDVRPCQHGCTRRAILACQTHFNLSGTSGYPALVARYGTATRCLRISSNPASWPAVAPLLVAHINTTRPPNSES